MYSCGSNAFGQLGIGNCQDSSILSPCLGIPNEEKLLEIASGDNHTLVLCESGQVYGTGSNSKGQLGEGNEILKFSTHFSPVLFTRKRAIKIGCGWEFSMILLEDHSLLVYGADWIEKCLSFDWKVFNFTVGIKSFILWESECKLHWFQESSSSSFKEPHVLHFEEPVKKVALSFEHCFVLLESGKLLAFESSATTRKDRFCLLKTANQIEFNDIVDVSTGWNHVILTRKHASSNLYSLYGFGRNDFGQLGGKPFSRAVSQPIQISIDGENAWKTTKVSCGSEHTLFLVNEKAFVCGWNEHGNCAISAEASSICFGISPLPIPKCLLIHGGCATSFFV